MIYCFPSVLKRSSWAELLCFLFSASLEFTGWESCPLLCPSVPLRGWGFELISSDEVTLSYMLSLTSPSPRSSEELCHLSLVCLLLWTGAHIPSWSWGHCLCNRSIMNTSCISYAFADLSGHLVQPESWSSWCGTGVWKDWWIWRRHHPGAVPKPHNSCEI